MTGHVIPALTDDNFSRLQEFLEEQLRVATAVGDAADSLATSLESSRLWRRGMDSTGMTDASQTDLRELAS
jgi:hypothetical protein